MAKRKGKVAEAEREPIDLGHGLEIRWLGIAKLKEQPINDNVMQPFEFDRLTENIREAGIPETFPYCYDPGDGKPVEIVDGHHRTRASRAAGLEVVPCIVNTKRMTRSELVSKQIAFNRLRGQSDKDILAEMLKVVRSNVDDLLRTGLTEEELPTVGKIDMPLEQPRADFKFRTITFTFLEHQLDDFRRVIESIPPTDLVGVADRDQYEAFTKAIADFIRIKEVRHIGTVISILTKIAETEVANHVKQAEADNESS